MGATGNAYTAFSLATLYMQTWPKELSKKKRENIYL